MPVPTPDPARRTPTSKSTRTNPKQPSGRKVGSKVNSKPYSADDAFDDLTIDASLDPKLTDKMQDAIDKFDRKESLREEEEAIRLQSMGVTTDGYLGWDRVCRKINNRYGMLPKDKWSLYRIWLLTKPERSGEASIYVEDLPKKVCEQNKPIKQGLFLPYPSGPHWENILTHSQYRNTYQNKVQGEELEEEVAYLVRSTLERDLRKGGARIRTAALAMLAGALSDEDADAIFDAINDELIEEITDSHIPDEVEAARYAWRTAFNASSIDRPPDPKTVVEALMRDDADDWAISLHKEFDGLNKQGVFSHDHTLEDLKARGIRGKPIPCRVALTYKYRDGWLEKLKSRICIAGHRGNVTKGIHYNDVFAPAPVEHTEKLLQAIMVIFHLFRRTWDIKQAYTWAPTPEGEKVAVVYPEGFKRHDEKGNELYMILEKNLYGMPSAGRGWNNHRNEFVEKRFNPGNGFHDDGTWMCRRCVSEPCLYVIDKKVDPLTRSHPRDVRHGPANETHRIALDLPENIERSWVLVHTDDCDGYGTSDDVLLEIMKIMNDEWEVEEVDSDYVLGIKRTLDTSDPDNWHVTLTMVPYMDELMEAWSEQVEIEFGPKWRSKTALKRTPFPEGVILSKSIEVSSDEIQRNLYRGYQSIVGSLLWAVRHCDPMGFYGCSQLCKLMSCPSDVAFMCALHLLVYMWHHRHEGIRFYETTWGMRAHVDASNNPDLVDGKCQYGFIIYLGGPVIVKSSKLEHVGMNSTYNEYQALTHCIKHIVWLRKVLLEMKLTMLCDHAVPVLADNAQANNLCKEDIVTKGNMYFNVSYHYNKEQVAAGNVNVFYIRSQGNVSDTTTKALGPLKCDYFRHPLTGYDKRVYETNVYDKGDNLWDSIQ